MRVHRSKTLFFLLLLFSLIRKKIPPCSGYLVRRPLVFKSPFSRGGEGFFFFLWSIDRESSGPKYPCVLFSLMSVPCTCFLRCRESGCRSLLPFPPPTPKITVLSLVLAASKHPGTDVTFLPPFFGSQRRKETFLFFSLICDRAAYFFSAWASTHCPFTFEPPWCQRRSIVFFPLFFSIKRVRPLFPLNQ